MTNVTRNVSAAIPRATPMTMPATAPFDSRLLDEADPVWLEFGLEGVDEVPLLATDAPSELVVVGSELLEVC